jgi:hypothetical protein
MGNRFKRRRWTVKSVILSEAEVTLSPKKYEDDDKSSGGSMTGPSDQVSRYWCPLLHDLDDIRPIYGLCDMVIASGSKTALSLLR